MTARPSWANFEPTPLQQETALLSLIESGDEFLDWLCCEALSDDIREPSRWFPEAGGISSVEMVRRAAAGDFDAEQCRDVFRELVERFKDARLEQITEVAKKAAIRDWPEDQRAWAEGAR